MDDVPRRPVATPPYAVAQSAPHQVLVCTSCKPDGQTSAQGGTLLRTLRAAVRAVGLAEDFQVSPTACLAGCDRACAVAFRAQGKATWVFGNLDPGKSTDDLIAFARLYARLSDGWCSGADCPPQLCANTLARIPAALCRGVA
jgi:predicted metal-binding protein